MNIRCFISIELPQSIKNTIDELLEHLRKIEADIKWVKSENLHITLKFLGNTDESIIPELKKAIQKKMTSHNPFCIKITDIGYFPNERHPRVIWVGISDSEALASLQRDVETAVTPFGYPPEDRPFSPHLTIGRARSQKRIHEVKRIIMDLSNKNFGHFEVNKVCIMQSILKPAGAEYHCLAETFLYRRNDDKQR